MTGETKLIVSPTSYRFIGLNEATSINIDTDASTVDFVRVNTYGTGTASFDFESKTLTSKTYGKGNYKFTATAEGATQKDVYFNLEVARPIIGKDISTIFISSDTTGYTWEYTPPPGYKLKMLDCKELKPDVINTIYNQNTVIITPLTVTSTSYDIIVVKISPSPGEENTEYIAGTLNINVYNLIIEPMDNVVALINKEEVIEKIQCNIGNDSTGKELTFENVFGGTEKPFSTKIAKIESPSSGVSYSITINTLEEGEGVIKIKYNEEVLKSIRVEVRDVKELTYEPNIKETKLRYNETLVLDNIIFNNNDVYDEIETLVSRPGAINVDLQNKGDNVYKLSITNIAKTGGDVVLTIKSINTREGQAEIRIKCFKQVVKGQIKSSPAVSEISIHEGKSYEFKYISVTNSDRLEAVTGSTEVCDVRLQDLSGEILEPDDLGDMVPVVFPPGSIQKAGFIIGKVRGNTVVTFKGVVNDSDISCKLDVKVKVLPIDELPDESKIVNLKNKEDKTAANNANIIIDLPEPGSVLVIKELTLPNIVAEFGYSYDYVETTNPSINTNPIIKTEGSGKPTWLNVTTNEVFSCIDTANDDNKWIGNKGTKINIGIVYPEPGEKGFGVGPCSKELSDKYKLKPLPGYDDPCSDNYGNYVDKYNSVFCFIPKHYIIPKFNPDLVGVYPYDGMEYEFSWTETGNFNNKHIPRCFINKGVVQEGIFVAKYNTNKFMDYREDIVDKSNNEPRTVTSGILSLYPVYVSSGSKVKKWHTTINSTSKFPELKLMSKVFTTKANTTLGRHNMSIFIQNMLNNLGDLHTIKTFEKSNSLDVCYKLKDLVSSTWVRECRIINTTDNENQVYNQNKELNTGLDTTTHLQLHYDNSDLLVKNEYKNYFSHNGQACGVFDISGGVNTPLTGLLVVQDNIDLPNTYKIYSLKSGLDIADVEKRTFDAVGESNTESVILRSPLLNIENYDLVATINSNEEVSKMLYMDPYNAYKTHLQNTSLLEGNIAQYIGLNTGINIESLLTYMADNYTERPNYIGKAMYNSKFRNCVFNMGFLSKNKEMQISGKTWVGMFTSNYVPNYKESKIGNFDLDGVYNGYRTRVLRHIGSLDYYKKSNSEYMFGIRVCITPNITNDA